MFQQIPSSNDSIESVPRRTAAHVQVERVDPHRAEMHANSFHHGLTRRNTGLPKDIHLVSAHLRVERRIFEDVTFDKVDKYTLPGLAGLYFSEILNPAQGYFMFLNDDRDMVGYGSTSLRAEELQFRFQIFPRFGHQGFGSAALDLIAHALPLEALKIGFPLPPEKVVFRALDRLPDQEIADRGVASGLPQFLMKRGFQARGDQKNLIECDFVKVLK